MRKNKLSKELIYAIKMGYSNAVLFSLKNGMSANASKDGWRALMLAASYGHLNIVKIFVKAEADINAIDKMGWTALMYAISNGHLIVRDYLKSVGAK